MTEDRPARPVLERHGPGRRHDDLEGLEARLERVRLQAEETAARVEDHDRRFEELAEIIARQGRDLKWIIAIGAAVIAASGFVRDIVGPRPPVAASAAVIVSRAARVERMVEIMHLVPTVRTARTIDGRPSVLALQDIVGDAFVVRARERDEACHAAERLQAGLCRQPPP